MKGIILAGGSGARLYTNTKKVSKQLFFPRGFAHGFAILSETAIFAYKVDNNYEQEYDAGIKYDDKELDIDWSLAEDKVQLSVKDKKLTSFKDLDSLLNFKV